MVGQLRFHEGILSLYLSMVDLDPSPVHTHPHTHTHAHTHAWYTRVRECVGSACVMWVCMGVRVRRWRDIVGKGKVGKESLMPTFPFPMPQPSISIGWGRGTSLLPISILRGFWWINLEAGTCNHYIIRPRVGPAGIPREPILPYTWFPLG